MSKRDDKFSYGQILKRKSPYFSKSDWIQLGTALILILNLLAVWQEYRSTQILNQPLCAFKEIKATKPRKGVVKVSAVVANFGNYVARDALIGWKTYSIERLKNGT